MSDFKLIINNSTNNAASLINNPISLKSNETRIEYDAFVIDKNISTDKDSNVVVRSNTITNTSDDALRLSHISSLFVDNIAPDFNHKDVSIHICNFTWQGEAQWTSYTPYEMGIYPVAAAHDFSHINVSISSIGSWSTRAYYPIIIIEDKTDGKAWFFELESGCGWSFEFGTIVKNNVCCITLDCTACNENRDGFFKLLQPDEKFETPTVLHGIATNFETAVTSLLKYKRSHNRRTDTVSVCFNDYMNCLWAQPSRERLIPLIDTAHNVGVETFCIDDGWFIRDKNQIGFGDWIEDDSLFDELKFKGIINYIKSKNMNPGLWFELETAFANSSIINIAPNAILKRGNIPVQNPSDPDKPKRYFLNFCCKEVIDYLYSRIKYFYDMGIRYIKNDYNQTTGIGCDGENASFSAELLENTRAFYNFIERIHSDMPELIIENCGSGAMRCDNGTLQHFHLQSISDQETFTNNPSIIRGMQCCMLPEKSGIWSYPFPATFEHRLNTEAVFTDNYMKQMSDGEQTIFNMACAFFGVMTLSGHIEKCDDYNLSLIKRAIDIYKSDRNFISEALPVFIGEQQRLFTEGYSILALKNNTKIRIGIFRNGGEDNIDFDIPNEFANGKLTEIYPCKDTKCTAIPENAHLHFKTPKKLCAVIYEIILD